MKDYLTGCGDVFGVEARLKEIDDGYRVFFNKLKSRFEVHNIKHKDNTLVLVSPYAELDSRLIRLVRSTRIERANEIFKSLEENNERLMRKQEILENEKAKLRFEQLQKMKKNIERGGAL